MSDHMAYVTQVYADVALDKDYEGRGKCSVVDICLCLVRHCKFGPVIRHFEAEEGILTGNDRV